ncbi:hypothetical protein HFD88_001599 [Aspergillus terreus]|nr:hypothetical protein HFD88_001599 [Aspergillus terreus]
MKPSSFILSLALAATATAQTINIVAHEDDDLLFLSPDLLDEFEEGRSVRTIFLTAGDAGNDESYWLGREEGSKAAYAEMSGVDNSWTQTDAGIDGFSIPLFTLNGNPDVSLVFLRLPDGNDGGEGFGGRGSLQQLWEGTIDSLTSFTDSSYDRDSLVDVLRQLLDDFDHDRVNTQDFVHDYGDGDHSDHHTTAYFVREAVDDCGNGQVTAYMGYPVVSNPQNVEDGELYQKTDAFYTYGLYDRNVCNSEETCSGRDEAAWLLRQYQVEQFEQPTCENENENEENRSASTSCAVKSSAVHSQPVIPHATETVAQSSSVAVPSETAAPTQLLFTGGSGKNVISGGVCIVVAVLSAIALI